jgi:hypothetical protein
MATKLYSITVYLWENSNKKSYLNRTRCLEYIKLITDDTNVKRTSIRTTSNEYLRKVSTKVIKNSKLGGLGAKTHTSN